MNSKAAWADAIASYALKLQDLALDCPGHAAGATCRHCNLMTAIAQMLDSIQEEVLDVPPSPVALRRSTLSLLPALLDTLVFDEPAEELIDSAIRIGARAFRDLLMARLRASWEKETV